MSCRKIRRSLSRYYRSELSSKESTVIAEHIQSCDRCAREAKSFKALNDAVQGLDRFSPSPAFESKLEQKIRELPGIERQTKAKFLVTSFPSLRWILIPATAIAVALFLFLKGDFQKSSTVSVKPEPGIPRETSSVKAPAPSEKSEPLLSEEEIPREIGKSVSPSNKVTLASEKIPLEERAGSRAVFIIDNLKFSDLEKLIDSKMLERRSANFVIDAVNYQPVDNRQSNVGYILPAVSTSGTEVKKSY